MGILIYLSSGLIEMALSDPIPFFGGTYQMVNAREIYEFTDIRHLYHSLITFACMGVFSRLGLAGTGLGIVLLLFF